MTFNFLFPFCETRFQSWNFTGTHCGYEDTHLNRGTHRGGKEHNSFKTLYKICFQVLAEAEDEFERLLNEAE